MRMHMRLAAAVLCLAAPVGAQAVSSAIPYRGKLETQGTPAEGQYTLRFALVQARNADLSCLALASPGGNCAPWIETHTNVNVSAGEFAVMLGSQTAIPPALLHGGLHLGIAVQGPTDSEFRLLLGTQELASAPQALRVAPPTPPVGTIMAWHKNLPGVPPLEAGGDWVECNGQVLNDPVSPLHGRTIPDLNNSARFLRGSTVSGTMQTDQMQSHRHADRGHTHVSARPPWYDVELTGGGSIRRPEGYDGTVRYETSQTGHADLGDAVGMAGQVLRVGSENRPVNMSVVWIMRVK